MYVSGVTSLILSFTTRLLTTTITLTNSFMTLTSAVLISYGCCNKLPQTYWLKTTQIYYLTVLESKMVSERAASLLEVLPPRRGESISLPFLAPRGCPHSLGYNPVSLQCLSPSLHLLLLLWSYCLTLTMTLVTNCPLAPQSRVNSPSEDP